ncbi:AraC family transcriptional regulator [Chitinophaga pendula]|uniref:helix-turn-helix transcriptional regulator n=1 Tax=Chitinophaga TaxID=79328 RepID=UPI0012FD5D2E|nr:MULTISPECIES: AraC family transcriptional regulator [Chitinophaga]UCJ05374.1 AraC family transcriptional regulator [Chitinophaga pendula]
MQLLVASPQLVAPKVIPAIEKAFGKYHITIAQARTLVLDTGRIISQHITFNDFTLWDHLFFIQQPITLFARADVCTFSLQCMLKNSLTTTLPQQGTVTLHEGQQCWSVMQPSQLELQLQPGIYRFFHLDICPAFLQRLCTDYPFLSAHLQQAETAPSRIFSKQETGISPEMKLLIDQIIQHKGTGYGAHAAIECWARHLFMLSLDKIAQRYEPHSLSYQQQQKERFSAIRAYIHNNLDEKLTIETIAKHFHMGTTCLKKGFREQFNTAVYDYILHRKIDKAKVLLQAGMSVREVAWHTGYSEQGNFSRVFKKHTGIVPGLFRKALLNAPDLIEDEKQI